MAGKCPPGPIEVIGLKVAVAAERLQAKWIQQDEALRQSDEFASDDEEDEDEKAEGDNGENGATMSGSDEETEEEKAAREERETNAAINAVMLQAQRDSANS